MSGNGHIPSGAVLHWPGRLLSAEDVRQRVNGHRELIVPARAVITPLADEQLRARGVRITRQAAAAVPMQSGSWGYSQERPSALVQSAVHALQRDGVPLAELPATCNGAPCHWARALAACVARGECVGGVVFCQDPGLVCCVANKVAGLRAVAVGSVPQAGRALLTLAPNLVAVEMPGRTFFEIRHILRLACGAAAACPDGVACTLRELDGHAHR